MTPAEEQAYMQGHRMAWLRMLGECLKNLGYETTEAKQTAWVNEREETIHALRDLCRDFGDNDWGAQLHLADVINNHLGKHLYANDGQKRPATLESIHQRGEKLLAEIYKSRIIPIGKLSMMSAIINAAYEAGKADRP